MIYDIYTLQDTPNPEPGPDKPNDQPERKIEEVPYEDDRPKRFPEEQ